MDPEIDPTAHLTDDKGKASACGVLMIVMSERYLRSSWCRDELEWFRKQIEDRAGEAAECLSFAPSRPTRATGPTSFATSAVTR